MTDRHETNNAARDVREGASLIQAQSIGPFFTNSGADPEPVPERDPRVVAAEEAVGWWSFHRWVLKAEHSVGIADLWRSATGLFHRLWKAGRIKHFLHGLRLGPVSVTLSTSKGCGKTSTYPSRARNSYESVGWA